jgi:hypothetical protein
MRGNHDEAHTPHFHALITRHPLKDDELLLSKDREIVSKTSLKQIRKSWEVVINETPEAGGTYRAGGFKVLQGSGS